MQKQINSWIAAVIIALILVVSMCGIGINAMTANSAANPDSVAIQITDAK